MANSGSEDDALDVFQDAVMALCKQIREGKFNESYKVSAFLFSVSKNNWINKAKRANYKIHPADLLDSTQQHDFSDDIITPQKEKALKVIIEKLGEKCFELLKMSIFYKYTADTICAEMGFATENSVKTQKYKCKQKLYKILEDHNYLQEAIE